MDFVGPGLFLVGGGALGAGLSIGLSSGKAAAEQRLKEKVAALIGRGDVSLTDRAGDPIDPAQFFQATRLTSSERADAVMNVARLLRRYGDEDCR